MALTFEYCRSCGGKTPIDTAVPAAERRCELCGEPCSETGDHPAAGECHSAAERPTDPEPGEWQARSSTGKADGHRPAEMVASTCPRCRADVAVNSQMPLTRQYCHACGMRLAERTKKKGRERIWSRFTPDGILRIRIRERVWMPIAGTTLVVVLIVIFGIWMAVRRKPEIAMPEDAGPAAPRLQIRRLLEQFTAARTPDELLPLIRNPATFEEPLREWCATHPNLLPLGGELRRIDYPREALGTRVAEVTISFPAGGAARVLTVETQDGFRVDWRAYSGVADMSLGEFLAKKPAAPALLMAVVRRSDYYNKSYPDEKIWQCLRVTDGSGRNAFYAYAPRNNDALMDAISILPAADWGRNPKDAGVSRPMALRAFFTRPESAASLQAEIESVTGDGWYVP